MLARILNFQNKTITSAALLLAGSMLASRILGLVRDRLLASRFGAAQDLDIYFAAFRIPDFIYGILIMGGFTAVFLPVFSEYFESKKDEAFAMVANLLNVLLFLLFVSALVLFLFMPFFIEFVTPGFTAQAKEATIPVARLMLLSPILLGLSAVFSGILQYFGRFFVYSLAPVLYNAGIIIGILFFAPALGVMGLAWGVVLGAALHFLIQLHPAFQTGFSLQRAVSFSHPALSRMAKLTLPRMIGAASFHVNLVVITALASTLAVGSIAILNFANNLHFLPIGVIGVSLATAAFPLLSQAVARKDEALFQESFLKAVRTVFFFIIPLSSFMFLLREHIIRLVLQTGEFGILEVRLTAAVFGAFALGVFFQSLVPLFARAFFALKDTKTPTLISMGAIMVNVAVALLLLWLFSFPNVVHSFLVSFLDVEDLADPRVLALPLAVTASISLQGFLLAVLLKFKIHLNLAKVSGPLNRIGGSGIAMGIVSFFALKGALGLFPSDTLWGVFWQAVFVVAVGLGAYVLLAKLLKVEELKLLPFFR